MGKQLIPPREGDVEEIALREALEERYLQYALSTITVRVKLPDDVADDSRAFLERGTGIETQLLHRVQQPPVNRLEPVAGIRQGAPGDRRERVLEIALL